MQDNRRVPEPDERRYEVSLADARGVVVGDRNVVVQNFTAGLSALATDYAVRIANFLTEYLGTAEHPVPFGGRGAELRTLDAFSRTY
jgi:hypothetical protein